MPQSDFWRHIYYKSPCPTYIIDMHGEIPTLTFANEIGKHILEHPSSLENMPLNAFFLSEEFQWSELLSAPKPAQFEKQAIFLFKKQFLQRVLATLEPLGSPYENQWVLYIQQNQDDYDYLRLRNFIEQNHEAILDIDVIGNCRVANEQGWDIIQYDKSLAKICISSYKAHSVQAPHKSFTFDHSYRRPDGTDCHLKVKFIPAIVEGKFDGGYIVAMDRSMQVNNRILLTEKSMQYEQLWNSPYMPILKVDHEAKIIRVNPAYEKLFGYSNDELAGEFNPAIPLELSEETKNLKSQLLKGKTIEAHETFRLTKAGERIDILAYYTPILNYRGHVLGAHILYNNISESKTYQRKLLKSQEKYQILSENAFDIISILDGNGRIKYVSSSVEKVAGYIEKDLMNSSIYIFVHPDDQELLYEAVEGDWSLHKRKKIELRLLNAQNTYSWNEVSITPLEHGEDDVKYICAVKDISKLKIMQEELSSMAFYDYLTGLPNRRLFDERLKQALLRREQTNEGLAILMVDGHGFKAINDQFGHDVGDEVIRTMGARLKACIGDGDTVARFGGDEMSIILNNVATQDQLDAIIKRIVDTFNMPLEAGGYVLNVYLGIGIATAPRDATEAYDLIRLADQALYRSKSKSKDSTPSRTTWTYYHQIQK